MLLQISTTHQPATDLGYLLHKHPDKIQSVELAVGKAAIFYSEANEERCTACLLLDINPLDLVRGKKQGPMAFWKTQYVNDRPYAASSFLGTAISKAFGSAMNGTCQTKPELAESAIPIEFKLSALKVGVDKNILYRLFEPLGYSLHYNSFLLDERFPDWGESPYVNLELKHPSITLAKALSQLYVMLLVLDNERHYWVAKQDIEQLMRRGETWLELHPEKEWIVYRFLKQLRTLSSIALMQLTGDLDEAEIPEKEEKKVSVHQQRLLQAAQLLKKSGAARVLDLGCGEGKLIQLLLKDPQFVQIAGMDVAFAELQKARDYLNLDDAAPALRERVQLFQGALTYKDARLQGFDAIALIEVIEHLDPERLPALEKLVFAYSAPPTIIISTPNADYNQVFERLDANDFRHDDHRFEWTRLEFKNWCNQIAETYNYRVEILAAGEEHPDFGAISQMAVFNLI